MSLFSFTGLPELAMLGNDRIILPGQPEPLWLRIGVELERARREARREAPSATTAALPAEPSSMATKGESNAERNAERAA